MLGLSNTCPTSDPSLYWVTFLGQERKELCPQDSSSRVAHDQVPAPYAASQESDCEPHSQPLALREGTHAGCSGGSSSL